VHCPANLERRGAAEFGLRLACRPANNTITELATAQQLRNAGEVRVSIGIDQRLREMADNG
jgi:hypothetical protein